MILGVTGSRFGWKPQQSNWVPSIFDLWTITEMHHGDCVGVDAEMHHQCKIRNIPIVIHPPQKEELRAFCEGYKLMLVAKSHFARNRDIVDFSELILAIPSHMNRKSGGTWYTANYAINKEKRLIILLPTGAVETYGPTSEGYRRIKADGTKLPIE